MKILIAPDKFKGSLTAVQVCEAISRGIKMYDDAIGVVLHPLADGGDGSVEILSRYLTLEMVEAMVSNPLGEKIKTHYYTSGKKAFIELATASGLVLLNKAEQNPLFTNSFGFGEMILDAIRKGAKDIYLFLGGSATNDAATGLAHALGYRFLDENDQVLIPNGKNLIKIRQIDPSALQIDLDSIHFTALCDVDNPLYGKNGAAYAYAAQKGASAKDVVELDKGLRHFADLVNNQFQIKIDKISGGGAAGGIGAGLVALFRAELKSGIQSIMELTNFEDSLAQVDLVISGEGKLDSQTLDGKVVRGVAALAGQYQKPFVLLVGQNNLTQEEEKELNAVHIYSILDKAKNKEEAMLRGSEILEQLGYKVAKKYGRRKDGGRLHG